MNRTRIAFLFGLCSLCCLRGNAADKPVLERTFDSTVERAYAAEVKAAGRTLKAAVKEACMVNFETRFYSGGSINFFRIIDWTATCKDAGNGKVVVTLSAQVRSNMFGDGKAMKKDADSFWSSFDSEVKNPVSVGSSPVSATARPSEESAKASLHISSDPSGAEISVDGDFAGNTPSDVKVQAGTHSIRISGKGFRDWERSIKVEAGDSRTIAASLEKAGT